MYPMITIMTSCSLLSICPAVSFPPSFPSSRPGLFICFCPVLLSSPAGQISVILTSLVRRSWDTPRQCWERISVEFNLDPCFSPRRWDFSSSINESNMTPSLGATGERSDTVFCPSLTSHYWLSASCHRGWFCSIAVRSSMLRK